MALHDRYRYIVIEGNIGAGKTSLAHKLAAETGGELLLEEFAENAFLPQFYKDPRKYALPLEMSFLAARYKQLSKFLEQRDQLIISDYHIRKSLLFAQHNLEPEELDLFNSFYEIVISQIPEPDLVIYLEKGIQKLKSNINKRNREYEESISEKYLQGIQNSYHSMLKNHPFKRLVIIDSDDMDFVNNENDYKLIINKLNE
jgi:deoxyguanosine kinase